MRGLETHCRSNDKLKSMCVLFRPAERARKCRGEGKRKKRQSRAGTTKGPAHYDIIKDPKTDEEIEHNQRTVDYLLDPKLYPFAHLVEDVGLCQVSSIVTDYFLG
jgi:hypothetical protein